MKKVLVTGATGFLGKYLVEAFKKEGWSILALGRNEAVGKALEDEQVKFCRGDFTDKASCRQYFGDVDCVVHAGALSSAWGRWEDFYAANVQGTRNICELCLEFGVKRIVYISSPSIYTAKKDRLDIREPEFDASNKLNHYIKSKILSESVIREYHEKGLYTIILRPRGLFGIGDTSLIPRVLRANSKVGIPLFRGGQNLVDITHVRNVAHACALAAEKDDISGEVFNITNGEPMEFRRILERFLESIGQKPKYLKLPFGIVYAAASVLEAVYRAFRLKGEPVLTRYTVCTLGFSQTLNIEKANEKLGYRPVITLEEGIKEYGQWWQKNNRT